MRFLRTTIVVVMLISLAAPANAQSGGGTFFRGQAFRFRETRALTTQARPPMRTSDRVAPYFGLAGLTLLAYSIWYRFFGAVPPQNIETPAEEDCNSLFHDCDISQVNNHN